METMSQFADAADLWKTRCLRFAAALVVVMDGTKDHDIQEITGLPPQDCDRIAEARSDARALVHEDSVLPQTDAEKVIVQCGDSLWGECAQYPKADWKHEVENEDTVLGYWEWVVSQAEANGDDLKSLKSA